MSAGSGASDGTMPPGWFVIESALDPNLVLDVPFAIKDAETKVWIHEKNGSDAQLVGSPSFTALLVLVWFLSAFHAV